MKKPVDPRVDFPTKPLWKEPLTFRPDEPPKRTDLPAHIRHLGHQFGVQFLEMLQATYEAGLIKGEMDERIRCSQLAQTRFRDGWHDDTQISAGHDIARAILEQPIPADGDDS